MSDKPKPTLGIEVIRSFPEAEGGQQGIATDGKHVYVQLTHRLVKHDLQGKVVARGPKLKWHHGGIAYHEGRIYAAVSECCKEGTDKHWICEYDAKTLEMVAEHDVAKWFGICAGGIAVHGRFRYVAESYWDNDHVDYIVQFDEGYECVREIRTDFICAYGIQGLAYLPDRKRFMVNSHGKDFYLIDEEFNSKTIEAGVAPFALQDVAYLGDSTVVVNDRPGKRIVVGRVVEVAKRGVVSE
ncbi:MAG: hypothetical protein GY851_30250 [bacterium]|nr:hypothetical protein [bacterium]